MSLQPSSSYLVNFSQNFTLLAVASDTCYSIYSVHDVDSTLHKIYTYKFDKIRIIELFFSASLVAMVTYNAPKRLKFWNYRKNIEICHYSFSSGIVAVKLNHTHIVIVLEEDIHIFILRTMKVKHTISNTPNNVNGICALSCESKENGFLAYPGSSTEGIVKIFDTVACRAKVTFTAFAAPIVALAFSPSGTEVAAACELGTVISVFSALDGTNIYKFLRGYKRYASINSLLFSACGNYLISSSNTETVHIFRLKNSDSREMSGGSVIGYLAKAVADYLPNDVSDVLLQRSYATAKLGEADSKRIGVINMIMGQLRLLIATEDGFLYSFSVPSNAEGECLLIRKHNLHLAEMDAMVESLKANEDDDFDVLSISVGDGAAGGALVASSSVGDSGAGGSGGVATGSGIPGGGIDTGGSFNAGGLDAVGSLAGVGGAIGDGCVSYDIAGNTYCFIIP